MIDHAEKVVLFQGKYLRFMRRENWEYCERLHICGIVGIVAVTPAGRLLLVEQYRPALAQRVIELPAGLAGDVTGMEDEDLSTAARRELLEETGYDATRMTFLCEGPPSSGMSTEIISLYRAEGLQQVHQGGGDETEDIIVHEIPLEEVTDWLEQQRKDGRLIDLRIYTALFFIKINPTNG
jgi:ADP-ribose pyrophosphatase